MEKKPQALDPYKALVRLEESVDEALELIDRLRQQRDDLLAALECEVALDSLYEIGQKTFKQHGYIKEKDGQAQIWVRKKSIQAIVSVREGISS